MGAEGKDIIPKPEFTYEEVLFKGVNLNERYLDGPDGEKNVKFARAVIELKRKSNKLNGILLDVIPKDYWNQKDSNNQYITTPYIKWKEIVQYYGDTNLATVAKLVGDFFPKVNKDFNSLETYLAGIKASANELNA